MKVVIDTNVIVSGFFWSGPPKEIIERLDDHAFDLFVTKEIIGEYQDLFERFEERTGQDTGPMLDFILSRSHVVLPVPLTSQICDDPDDDIFIACALGCNADYLITGDKLLLACTPKMGGRIVKPREFLDVIS